MVEFPDLASLEKSSTGEEYIYGGSIGVNRILGFYREAAFLPHRIDWALHAINLFMVARNVHAMVKEGSDKDFAEGMVRDVRLLTQYIQAYAGHSRRGLTSPLIIFFLPDYSAYPAELLRKPSDSDQKLWERYNRWAKPGRHGTQELLTDVWQLPAGSATRFPHQELASFAGSKRPLLSQEQVVLLTNCVTDYHLASRLRNTMLLESYTGRLRTAKEFGERLDNSGVVPFNTYTHRVLGDSVHLAPLVRGPTKKAVLTKAAERRWQTRTEAEILADLTATTGIASEELRRIKF